MTDKGVAVSGTVPVSTAEGGLEAVDGQTLADAVVAAGVAVPQQGGQPVEIVSPSVTVTGVDAVVAAFAPTAVKALEPTQVLVQAASAVADTLLVTPGLLRGEGEIRVQLKPDVLEGTEIKINVTGGRLAVEFAPMTQDMAVLIERCRPQLVEHLADKVRAFQIAVEVRRRTRTEEQA